MTVRSYGAGRVAAAEADLVITAPGYAGGGPIVVVCHGAGGGPSNYTPAAHRRDLDLLANSGCVVVVAELGGGSTWGIDTVVHATTGRIRAAIDYAATAWGGDLDRVALIGDSMGAMNALNFMWRAPAGTVKAAALRVPVVAADALHDRNGAIAALMDAAWGSGANWEAAKDTRDPSAAANAAAISAFKDSVRVWYSTDDPTVLPADITAFTAATGVEARPLGAVAHTEALIYGAVHAQDQATWIWSRFNA